LYKFINIVDVEYGFIFSERFVLVACRTDGIHLAGNWGFPGGKIEPGETPEQCLKRELKEDFNIESKLVSLWLKTYYHYADELIRLLDYKVKKARGKSCFVRLMKNLILALPQ
jgi:8-oxo-dGTP diphosphatase